VGFSRQDPTDRALSGKRSRFRVRPALRSIALKGSAMTSIAPWGSEIDVGRTMGE